MPATMRIPARPSMPAASGLAAALLLLAGCGTDDSSRARAVKDAGPAAVEAQLDVVLRNVGGKTGEGSGLPVPSGLACSRSLPATCRGTIECPAPSDARPHAAATCDWLADGGAAALRDEGSGDEVCTEIYGGPEVARVTGTIDGKELDATFTRVNGCQIARYDRASPLWTRGDVRAEVPSSGTPVDPGAIEPDVIDDPPEAFGR